VVNSTLLLIHASATWYMVGLIWLIQVVHYPLMQMVGRAEFVPYSLRHQQAITPVVGIPMLIEVVTAVVLLVQDPYLRRSGWFLASCVLLVVIWVSTAFWQVPLHRDLLDGHAAERVNSLVLSNWVRTIAWSARGLIVGALVLCRMKPSYG
jgi:hypothetical protein